MSVEVHSTGVVVKDRYGCTTKAWTHLDPYVATRRAIVKAAAEFERERLKVSSAMIKINGESFICSCGANVFSRKDNIFTCNACGAEYEGE